MDNCFCHLNGYAVKDATARNDIAALTDNYNDFVTNQTNINTAFNQFNQNVESRLTDLESNVLFVSVAKAGGDYTTINAAINAKYISGVRLVVLIFPGVYSESVDIRGKNIALIGIDRKKSIITSSGDYNSPPINASGCDNLIKNLTIMCNDDGSSNYSNLAYCIHIDHNSGAGESLIEDCDLISYQSACVGIGTHSGQHITIRCCNMLKKANARLSSHSSFNNGVVYGHDSVAAGSGQKISLLFNKMHTESGKPIEIFDANNNYPGGSATTRDSEVCLIGNSITSDDGSDNGAYYYPKKLSYTYGENNDPIYYYTGYLIRSPLSSGNNSKYLDYRNANEPIKLKAWGTAATGDISVEDITKFNYILVEAKLANDNYEAIKIPIETVVNGIGVAWYHLKFCDATSPTSAYYDIKFAFINANLVRVEFVHVGAAWNPLVPEWAIRGIF